MMAKAENLEIRGRLLLLLKICNYRIHLVLQWQMSGWELCAVKHLSWARLSHMAAPGGSKE